MKKTESKKASSYATSSKSYKAFLALILRQKPKYESPDSLAPGLLTSFYLDCFLLFDKEVCSETVIAAGLCKPKKFTEWREEQRRLGNLAWTTETTTLYPGKSVPKYTYEPGPKILNNLHKVAAEHNLVATKGYVDRKVETVQTQVHEQNDRLTALENLVDVIIEAFDPPGNEEKRKKYSKDPDGLLRLINSGKRKAAVGDQG